MALPRPQGKTPEALYQAISLAFAMIDRGAPAPEYTTATKPDATKIPKGTIIYVSNGGAGAVFQGSTGSGWVNLG